ncbi:MAG: monovalent cation/H(+) antiporter subunit G [Demequina sp.]
MNQWLAGDNVASDVFAITLVALSGVLSLAAGIGLLRLPDTMQRLHAGAKPQVLGVIVICVAVMVRVPSLSVLGLAILVILFQMLTQPISAHMAARAAYRGDAYDKDLVLIDEFEDDVSAADRPPRR